MCWLLMMHFSLSYLCFGGENTWSKPGKVLRYCNIWDLATAMRVKDLFEGLLIEIEIILLTDWF